MHALHTAILLTLAALTTANPLLLPRATDCVSALGGTCKNTASGCSDGSFIANHCPGAANIRCCVPATHVGDACTAGSFGAGTCALKSSSGGGCSGGTFHAGFCKGPDSTQCCVKTPTTSEDPHVGDSCKSGAGKCADTASGCSGGQFYTGFCGGPAAIKCCVKDPTGGGGGDDTPTGTGEKYPINEKSIQLLESEEGFRADFYYIQGHKTIGYGHDCQGAGHCDEINPPLSRAEGEALFRKDLPNYEDCICEHAGGKGLNANQYGALVSFSYNSGCGGVIRDFGSKLTAGDYSGICDALPTTNTLDGLLTSRRRREAELCGTATSEKSSCAQ